MRNAFVYLLRLMLWNGYWFHNDNDEFEASEFGWLIVASGTSLLTVHSFDCRDDEAAALVDIVDAENAQLEVLPSKAMTEIVLQLAGGMAFFVAVDCYYCSLYDAVDVDHAFQMMLKLT